MLQDILFTLILGLLGCWLFWQEVSRWRERLACKEETQGKCLGFNRYRCQKSIYTYARFQYCYAGKMYEQNAVDVLSNRQKEKLIQGQIYTIYVNPRQPKECRCTNTILKLHELISFFMSVVLLLLVIFSIFLR